MSRFDAILFDLGSTLIYFDAPWSTVAPEFHLALLRRLQTAGLDLDGPLFLAQFQQRIQDYYAQRDTEFIEHTTAYVLRNVLTDLGQPQVAESTLRDALAAMYAVSQAHWQVEPDAHAMLQALQRAGYRLGLISNAADDADVQALIDQADLRPYFEIIVTSAAAGIRKPNPRIFWEVLHPMGIAPNRAVMVGASLGADILGARNAGLTGVWITRRAETAANRDHLDTIQPHASIAALAELPELIERL